MLPQPPPLLNAQHPLRRVQRFAAAAFTLTHTHTHPVPPAILLPWCRLQYFSRVFRATKFSFLDSLKEVIHDIKYYLVFLALIL